MINRLLKENILKKQAFLTIGIDYVLCNIGIPKRLSDIIIIYTTIPNYRLYLSELNYIPYVNIVTRYIKVIQ